MKEFVTRDKKSHGEISKKDKKHTKKCSYCDFSSPLYKEGALIWLVEGLFFWLTSIGPHTVRKR